MIYADRPIAEAAVLVAAPPARVWALASDIFLLAELSRELQQVQWLPGWTGPARGARFQGRSRHPQVGEWTTVSEVVEYAAPRVFTWAVADPERPAAVWGFELSPRAGGTDLRQWAQLGPGPSHLTEVIAAMPAQEERIVAGRLREFRAGIHANLAAIKERAESG